MPTDWLVYWLTRPSGLALIAMAFVIPFLIWRAVLGSAYIKIGIKPLALAYLSASIGLLVMGFVGSHMEFSSRVANGILRETQRWSIVPGWTIYITILLLVFVFPLLGLVCVPLTAAFLKRGLLTPRNIALFTLVLWLALTTLGWAFPGNDWHRTHRLESFIMGLKDLLPGILFVALPFMLAVYRESRSYRLQRQNASA